MKKTKTTKRKGERNKGREGGEREEGRKEKIIMKNHAKNATIFYQSFYVCLHVVY